jgi:hypothetical protein
MLRGPAHLEGGLSQHRLMLRHFRCCSMESKNSQGASSTIAVGNGKVCPHRACLPGASATGKVNRVLLGFFVEEDKLSAARGGRASSVVHVASAAVLAAA